MQPFTTHTGLVAAMDRANVDTDQIIPKQFLKRIERTGWGEYLFFDWRLDVEGDPRPDFELNNPAFEDAKVLIAGRNFGCGSSREHAPWALQGYGFEVLVAPSFGDIFVSNCVKVGLVPITLPAEQVRRLIELVDAEHGSEVTVDLEARTITGLGDETVAFSFDEFARYRLLNGVDEIGLTLEHSDAISAYESAHPPRANTLALK